MTGQGEAPVEDDPGRDGAVDDDLERLRRLLIGLDGDDGNRHAIE